MKEIPMNNELFEQWMEFGKNANEPLLRLGEISAQAMEQLLRQQLELARDYVELGTRQMELLGSVQDPQKWMTEQGALASEFGKKLMSRSQAFAEVATEAQKAIAGWTEDAAKKATQAPKTQAGKSKAA